jgi:hypothetical protein
MRAHYRPDESARVLRIARASALARGEGRDRRSRIPHDRPPDGRILPVW